jgi:hypothetical protein
MSIDPKTFALDDSQRQILADISDSGNALGPRSLRTRYRNIAPQPHGDGHHGESFGAAAERLGYMGSVEEPPDPSTYSANMEGFGQREKITESLSMPVLLWQSLTGEMLSMLPAGVKD